MSLEILTKLLAIFATVLLGWWAGRRRWLGDPAPAAQALSNAAFYLFVPALLFRTMATLDLATLPWRVIAAYFGPALAFLVVVYALQRRHAAARGVAAPATRTVAAVYGNGVQLGIPMAAALFGEAGLAVHLALLALHGVILLTVATVLVELDLARADPGATLRRTVSTTVRSAVLHPVTLPVLAGLAWNRVGLPLPAVADETLAGLGRAVVPLCLVLIGLTLAQYGLRGQWRDAVALGALKLLALPALVLLVAHWGFGLTGTPLAAMVAMAALPSGTNALIFAQRYQVQQAEATAAIVVSTVAFVATIAFWLAVLAAMG